MKNRNIFAVILLGLVTFGIYDLFWLKSTRDEMVAKGAKIPRFYILLLPLLILAGTAVLQLIIRFILGPTTPGFEAGDGLRMAANAISVIAGIVAILIALPIAIYWTYKYSEGVEYVTKGQTTTATSFILAIVLSLVSIWFAWPGIIQDAYNKVSAQSPQA